MCAPSTIHKPETDSSNDNDNHLVVEASSSSLWQATATATTTTTKKKKHYYLITDPGFGSKLALNLVVLVAVIFAGFQNQVVYHHLADFYNQIQLSLLETAHSMALWSLVGLLSSSCCALQLLLNACSMGCAGFNAVLGPLRPTFLALTIVLQSVSWYVAFTNPPRSFYRHPYAPTMCGTILSVTLSLMPEWISWRTQQRQSENTSANNNDARKNTMMLSFQLTTMGCAACVSTVSNVLASLEWVSNYQVSLEVGKAVIMCCNTTKSSDDDDDDDDLTMLMKETKRAQEVVEKLGQAGFPATYVGVEDHDDKGMFLAAKRKQL